jgi:DUF438 domain-containing protein
MIENLSKDVLEAVMNTLPVEVSFVDENDTVQYFNKKMGIAFFQNQER